MRPMLALAALLILLLGFATPGTPVSEESASRVAAIAHSCTNDVLLPMGSLFRRMSTQVRAGTWHPGDPANVAQADAYAETAFALATEARQLWCGTEGETEFMVYVVTSRALLAADALAQGVRYGRLEDVDLCNTELDAATRAVDSAALRSLLGR